MNVEMIAELVEAGISVIAFVISLAAIRKGASKKTVKTIECIAEEAKAKADAYFEKQCKKNKIDATQITETKNE